MWLFSVMSFIFQAEFSFQALFIIIIMEIWWTQTHLDVAITSHFLIKKQHNWLINECRQDLTGERQGKTVVKDWGRLVTSHSEQTTVKSILVTNRLPGFLKDPFLSLSFTIEQSSDTLISQHTYNYNFHAMLFTTPYLFKIQVLMGFKPF